jgi:hypothetical protein
MIITALGMSFRFSDIFVAVTTTLSRVTSFSWAKERNGNNTNRDKEEKMETKCFIKYLLPPIKWV